MYLLTSSKEKRAEEGASRQIDALPVLVSVPSTVMWAPQLWSVTVTPREGVTVSLQRGEVWGITEGFPEEVSSVLGLKILVSFPQSRGGTSGEHRCEGGGVQEAWELSLVHAVGLQTPRAHGGVMGELKGQMPGQGILKTPGRHWR